jgi:hypothetical protein
VLSAAFGALQGRAALVDAKALQRSVKSYHFSMLTGLSVSNYVSRSK